MTKSSSSPSYAKKSTLAFFICLLFQILDVSYANYRVTIAPREEECFAVNYVESPYALVGDFEQLDGWNSHPLSLVVMDAENERVMWRSRRKSKDGRFRVQLKQGQKAQLCLQNGILDTGRKREKDDGKERVVGLQFSIEPIDNEAELKTQNNRLIESSKDLQREISVLLNHMGNARARESIHRGVVEETFTSLLFWFILEAVALVGIAAAQVLYFRRFLEKPRYI